MSTRTSPEKPAVALIAGPTASGKSDLAVRLALALKARGRTGIVINADSAQVYADLRVLSARPSEDEMQGIDHRLFGTWDGAQACSAADWAQAARQEIARAHAAGAVPILVGGTGLYLRTLIDGIAKVPVIDPAVREAVRALAPGDAYAALSLEDPQRAAILHRNDKLRIARALEVVRSTGLPLAYWQQANGSGIDNEVTLHPVILRPPLSTLRERTEARFTRMLDEGAVEEVRALLDRGLSPDLPVMRAIGVPEIAGWLGGVWSREEAELRGQRATWQYVRRQFTWLRAQPPPHWPRIEEEPFDEEVSFASLLR
ncbi:tRNA (adenosine(37)-N6)-dimethylallyltransferase MiaA [Frankia sp. BMG5.11]|uniref:tRNA (adenosine(37)-N6)-dimethylallyltransferase MiaA n=1 Tax=Parafrankia sp. BMG5.11 TaxID=222540 RepID=UPI001039DE62|nr:tRNA (adenosine(37)-N6)-dimethylallyltransferase MiaA [Parafrankia sp. BMG5.11]